MTLDRIRRPGISRATTASAASAPSARLPGAGGPPAEVAGRGHRRSVARLGHLGCAGRPRADRRREGDRLHHRRHPHGRGDGFGRLPAHRRCHRCRHPRAHPGGRHLALRRCPAGRGRRGTRWGRARSSRPWCGRPGRVPQISVVLGPAAGGAAYGPALTDIVIMAPEGRIFVTGPDVVKSVTGEQVDMEALGGPSAHGRKSGVVHILSTPRTTPTSAPAGWSQPVLPPGHRRRRRDGGRPGTGQRAARAAKPRLQRQATSSTGSWTSRWRSCRRAGRPTSSSASADWPAAASGVVANNPLRLGGCLDSTSAEKASRFVRMCDAFGIPLLVHGGRARLPTGSRPGVGRGGSPRRQAAARLRRGGGAPGDAGDPQGVRRRVHRDEFQGAGRHRGVRLARTPRLR